MLRAGKAIQRQRKDSGLFTVVYSLTQTYCLQLFFIQDHYSKVLSPLSQTVKMYLEMQCAAFYDINISLPCLSQTE